MTFLCSRFEDLPERKKNEKQGGEGSHLTPTDTCPLTWDADEERGAFSGGGAL